MLYRIGVSVLGSDHVFLRVGVNAIRSILTAMITDTVGPFVSIHGISPRIAMIRNTVSIFLIF